MSSGGHHVSGRGQLLLRGAFARLSWGKLAGGIGIWIHGVAASILMYDVTDSALMVSLVSVVQFLPLAMFTPTSGAFADRGFERAQMLAGRLGCTVGSGAIEAVIFVFDQLVTGLVVTALLSSTLLVGIGLVVGEPTQQSVVPQLVAPRHLSTAMAMNTLPMTAARVIGPVVAALIVTRWGVDWAFAVAAVMHGSCDAWQLRAGSADGARLTSAPSQIARRYGAGRHTIHCGEASAAVWTPRCSNGRIGCGAGPGTRARSG